MSRAPSTAHKQELSPAERMIAGLSPKQVEREVFAAARRVEGLDLTGNKPVDGDMLKDIELARAGLPAYLAAGEKQGADLPMKAEAANPASGRKMGGFALGQILEAGVTGAAYWAMGPAAAVGLGAFFGGRQVGKAVGLWPSGPSASRPGDDIAAAGMRGYTASPGKKGSMTIGGGTSFAKSADRTPQASLAGVGRADVFDELSQARRPTLFEQAFDQVKIKPSAYKAARELDKTVAQQDNNARDLIMGRGPKMDLLNPEVVADNSPFKSNFGAMMWAAERGGRGSLMMTGKVDRRDVMEFLGEDTGQRVHRPSMAQQAELAAVNKPAMPAPAPAIA